MECSTYGGRAKQPRVLEALKEAVGTRPLGVPNWLAGYLATTRGRFDEVISLLQRAVSADPLQPWNYMSTGYVGSRTGDLAKAETLYKKALELGPTVGKFYYVLGSLFLIRGQGPAALIEMLRETNEGFRQCGLLLALDGLGHKSEADRHWWRARCRPMPGRRLT